MSVDEKRKLTLHRVTVAGDVGPIFNMSGAESQVQGSVIDGYSTMAGLAVDFSHGRIKESNFHEYPLLRVHMAPKIDVHFLQSDHPPTGLGEPALPPLAAAISTITLPRFILATISAVIRIGAARPGINAVVMRMSISGVQLA